MLNNFAVPRRLGIVGGADAIMRLAEGTNRLPAAHFKAWAGLPTGTAHDRPVADFAPDLAVEVLSDGNTPGEIERKRREYFAAGTQLVWIVDPQSHTVAAYTDPDAHALLTAADVLTGDPVLPGFRLPVADVFSYLDRPPA